MITISIGDRDIVRIDSWEDMTQRAGFTQNVDPEAVELASIVGNYQLADLVRCGLSSCRQPHGRGYLVSTHDGRLTNIGKDCGKTHFGVEFETMRRQFDRDLRNRERREAITAAQHRVESLLAEIAELREAVHGADWVNRNVKRLTTHGGSIPNYIVSAITEMVRARSAAIVVQREATDAEIELLEIRERRTVDRPFFVNEEIGALEGLSALYDENDLRRLLILDLVPNLEGLRRLDVDQLTDAQLLEHGKWVADIDEKLDRMRSAVRAGQRLLAPRNVAQLAELARSVDDQRAITSFAKSLRISAVDHKSKG